MGSVGKNQEIAKNGSGSGMPDYSAMSLKRLDNILETSNYIDEIENIKAELINRERRAEDIDTKYPIQKMIDKADALIYELRKNY